MLSRSMVKILSTIALASLVATSFSGCSLFASSKTVSAPILLKAPASSYRTEEVKKGNIQKTISSSGTFVSNAQQNVSFTNHGGRLVSLKVKAGDDVKKGQILAQLDTDSLNFDLQKAQLELQKAQVAYQMEADAGSDENKLKLSEIDVQECQLQVDELQGELQKATMTAPISGKVVYIADVKIGDTVQAYQTLISIGDESQIQVECRGEKLDSFKIGMKAQIDYNNENLTGEVVTTPDAAPSSGSGSSAKAYVRVKLDKLPSQVKLGDGVNVSVIIEKKDDVIVIPADRIKDFGGKSYVSVMENGNKVDKLVEIGIKTDTQVEIIKGLNVGDKYITES